MASTDIQLDTYVDIAVSVASQGRRYSESKSPASLYSDTSIDDWNQDSPASEWRTKISSWMTQHREDNNSIPMEKCDNLDDFDFSTFFLQYPIPAMHLRNVMQGFYELDRVVCGTSKISEEKILGWESMGFFEYLKARKVERKWRNSLQNMRDGTGTKQNKTFRSVDRLMETESRIIGMQHGVDALADAWEELRRSFAENLKGTAAAGIAESMLSEIELAVTRRFLMVDNYLKFDRNGDENGAPKPQVEFSSKKNSETSIESENEHTFKPLSRSNSMKRYALVAITSSKRGEATIEAIILLFVLLVVLVQLHWYLNVLSN